MQLYFPSREILRAALTSGAITRTVASAPVKAAYGDGGALWLQPSKTISKTRLTELEQLGARVVQDDRSFTLRASCWEQVLPAEPATHAAEYDANAMVLFELYGEDQLQEFVTEMLRLDNDRQSYRVLEEDGAMRTLLHVKGPPYYTLLRAIDNASHNVEQAAPPVAYREQAPGVWVQWGFEHPMAGSMTAPAGQTLLIRAPHDWTYLEDGAFKDIYQAVKVELPQQPATLAPSSLGARIRVPLSLAPASSSQPARLWVLGEEGLEQLDEFVRTSDKRLVDRLSFAVGEATAGEEGQATSPVIVLRVRASNQSPPVLVLPGAIACRNYLKKPNLFIPCNLRLHPPVNPKVVNELLARDPEQIVWLQQDEDVAFRVRSLPDAAFQPLHKWVDYVLQREAEPLQAWVAAHQFEFEPFVCRNDQIKRAKKPPPRKAKGKQTSGQPAVPAAIDETDEPENASPTTKRPPVAFTPLARPEPGALEKELEALQQDFRASQEPLDSEIRSQQWRHLGSLYNALGVSKYDCSLCWVNGLWESPQPPPAAVASWLEAEKPGASTEPLTGEVLDAMMAGGANAPAETSAVCAYVVWSSIQSPPPEEVISRLPQISEFLTSHERDMPVRMAWLAWTAVVAMSSGDELALARARDRLLGRLHQQGLQPNLDLASFLRTKGEGDANRIAAVQQQLPVIHRKAMAWVNASVGRSDAPPETAAQTTPLADLIFAFGLARLGDVKASHEVRTKAEKELLRSSEMHRWCGDVFAYRIREAIDARPPAPLDESLTKRLQTLQNGPQAYAVDKYRERSRLLHDEQQIDEYAHSRVNVDELKQEFIRLSKLTSPDEIRTSVQTLIARFDEGGDKLQQRAEIVAKSLEYAPQIGAVIGRELLSRACGLLNEGSLQLHSRAPLLEKGVLVAAHFDHVEYVRVLVNALEETAGDLIEGFFAPLKTGANSGDNNLAFLVDSLFKQCLRGMQKMGLRSETSTLLSKLHEALDEYGRKKQRKSAQRNVPVGQMDMQWCRLQLHVAAGYFYFGREDEAVELVDEIRDELFNDKFVPNPIFKTRVVCGYIEALAQAPPQIALPRIEQIFNPPAVGKPALTGVFDNRANAMMYMLAIAPLEVVEAAVIALCGEDAGIDRESRRWLDEDEFLVRRRIHSDVRKLHGA